MNIKKLFYILFAADIIIGIILSLLLNLIIGGVTSFVLLFINIITFIIIKKIQKVQRGNNGTKK
ncbi:MAG: hypothetical protein WCS83_01605 [Endomicrobiia bacterium]|nr:hypothetical protein [Endomicrobiaceae bacterium]MDD3053418.1 hypothetical protein [Endomicrobiaceae bacterium]MDD3922575.1 hypothetical protein [Endomicrobiaceae bacterium]MDD5101571.1 hypothetical protein [Endomicrobiaceae bacterium]